MPGLVVIALVFGSDSQAELGRCSSTRDTSQAVYESLEDVLLRGKSGPVETTGVLVWLESEGYDAVLADSILSRYELLPNQILYVDFLCGSEVRHLLDRRYVVLRGYVVRVCDSTPVRAGFKGHCHYTDRVSLMRVNEIVEIGEERYNVVRGQENQALVTGDFFRTDVSDSVKRELDRAVATWLELMFTPAISRSTRSGLYRYFTMHPAGPLRGKKPVFSAKRYAVFGPRSLPQKNGPQSATICYCVARNCDKLWPIEGVDAATSIEDFICDDFYKEKNRDWAIRLEAETL